jgi:hypothetical protein
MNVTEASLFGNVDGFARDYRRRWSSGGMTSRGWGGAPLAIDREARERQDPFRREAETSSRVRAVVVVAFVLTTFGWGDTHTYRQAQASETVEAYGC